MIFAENQFPFFGIKCCQSGTARKNPIKWCATRRSSRATAKKECFAKSQSVPNPPPEDDEIGAKLDQTRAHDGSYNQKTACSNQPDCS
jgi:hypothetical protein